MTDNDPRFAKVFLAEMSARVSLIERFANARSLNQKDSEGSAPRVRPESPRADEHAKT